MDLGVEQAEVPSPSPAMQAEREAEAAAAPAAEGARQREETPEAAAERIQLVLRIGHLTPPQVLILLCCAAVRLWQCTSTAVLVHSAAASTSSLHAEALNDLL